MLRKKHSYVYNIDTPDGEVLADKLLLRALKSAEWLDTRNRISWEMLKL